MYCLVWLDYNWSVMNYKKKNMQKIFYLWYKLITSIQYIQHRKVYKKKNELFVLIKEILPIYNIQIYELQMEHRAINKITQLLLCLSWDREKKISFWKQLLFFLTSYIIVLSKTAPSCKRQKIFIYILTFEFEKLSVWWLCGQKFWFMLVFPIVYIKVYFQGTKQ